MRKWTLIFGIVLLFSCEKESEIYSVTFTTDVVVNNCTSIDVTVSVQIEAGANVEQSGILYSLCGSPVLTDPNDEGSSSCIETPHILVSTSNSTQYSFQLSDDLYVDQGLGFNPGDMYFLRPFVVIDRVPYYGDTVQFGC